MKTLASLFLILLIVALFQGPAHAQFVIASPSYPEVSGTVAVKLGTIPSTVWWTCIKVNSSPGCSASGYNPIAWDTTKCMSSEPFGQVSNRFKRGSGSSELKLWLQTDDAAGVVARWFSA